MAAFLDGIADDVASTATLGFCNTSGCDKSPSHGVFGSVYNKISGNSDSNDNTDDSSDDPVTQLSNALSIAGIQSFWSSLPADQQSLIIKIGLAIGVYYLAEILYGVFKVAKKI